MIVNENLIGCGKMFAIPHQRTRLDFFAIGVAIVVAINGLSGVKGRWQMFLKERWGFAVIG